MAHQLQILDQIITLHVILEHDLIRTGSTNTRTADNILSCATLPTYGRLPMFTAANKVLEDSSISSFDVVQQPKQSEHSQLSVLVQQLEH